MLAVDDGNGGGDRADLRQCQMKYKERRPVGKLENHPGAGADVKVPEAGSKTFNLFGDGAVSETAVYRIDHQLPLGIALG